MTDDDFKRLVTLYLEDAIGESDRKLLNAELREAPDRVRQFNDLRMLAGMILEHGRSGMDLPKVAEFPPPAAKDGKSRPWLAAAALLMAGLLAGLLLGPSWRDKRGTDSDPGTGAISAVSLIDGGFEQTDPGIVTGYPKRAGYWSGDAGKIVSTTSTGIDPCEGDSMLCFAPKAESAPAPVARPQRVVQWQIVDLAGAEAQEGPVVATLCARFNRDQEVAQPGLPCRVELYAFRGPPATAKSQLESDTYLAAAATHLQTDADPRTWEIAKATMPVSPEADFLLLGISGSAELIDQPFGGQNFSGDYADRVELTLTRNHSSQ